MKQIVFIPPDGWNEVCLFWQTGKTNCVFYTRQVKQNAFLLPDGQKNQMCLYHLIGKMKGVFSARRVKQIVFIPSDR